MIELYIDGHKADLTTDVSVPMNYELEKLQNPTIIKNNFSKTIQLQATPTNNKIFSFFYELDKVHTENSFCANKRVPFQLFRDSDLIESGYLQLNNIKYTKNNYVYEITLYGGLGDFFYNLSYDADGNDLSLADLNYGLGENDSDFQFEMNADFVSQCWYNSWVPAGHQLDGGVLSFIPSYNGIYDDFDNDKVLINTKDNTLFPTSFTADSKTYSTISGYGMAELNNELTEWQIRDLRCYKQRPALRLQSFIQAICNPENNGGYEVELDAPNFFNRENPYYTDTWIALPLLNPDSEELPKTKVDLNATINDFTIPYADYGIGNIVFDNSSLKLIDDAGGTSTINMEYDFSLSMGVTNGVYSSLFLSGKPYEKYDWYFSCIGVWVEATQGGTVVGESDCLVFSSGYSSNGKYTIPTYNNVYSYNVRPNSNFITIDGYFTKQNNSSYVFIDKEKKNNTFRLTINNLPSNGDIQFKVKARRWFNPEQALSSSFKGVFANQYMKIDCNDFNIINNVFSSLVLDRNYAKKTLQNTTITKKQLLKNKITPASLLTSFTKLFGLYFVKDATQKKIKICTRNTFFENADIIDIDDKIDYSSEYKIEPLMFNKKWYKLSCPPLETTQMKTYKGDYYEAEYGQKRINTNYNFNTDTEDLYKDNQYQNVITMLDSSKYYRNFSGVDGVTNAPTFAIDGCKYTLWNDGNVDEVSDKEYIKKDIINKDIEPVQFGTLVGADSFSKICCFDLDNDKQSLNDLNVSLVFFNGLKYLEDSKGNPIYYTISNDIPLMSTINEGTPMYLYSKSSYDINNNRICVRTNQLPQFTRYNIELGNVVNSLDFGLPLETYINENYTEDSTLYNKFWQKFYQDQFSENTRKVTVYVKFDDIQLGNHSLSNFYYFNNCYWLLNKIIDYDIANPYKKVKCEFIKINDIANYTNGQQTFVAYFEVDPEFDGDIEDWNILTPGYVNYGGSWIVEFTAPYGIETISTNGNYTLTQNGSKYTLTINNITDDIGVYIAAKRGVDINVAYYFKSGITPTTGHSHQFLEVAFDEKSANNIVYTNVVDEADSMTIKAGSPSYIYWRINPNPYYNNTSRLNLSIQLFVTYEDGTRTNIVNGGSSTDAWTGNINAITNVITDIELVVYQFADASYVPSDTTECYDDSIECDFDEDGDGIDDSYYESY